MRKLLLFSMAAMLLAGCDKAREPREDYLDILRRVEAAARSGDLKTWESLVHPYSVQQWKLDYKLRGKELTAEALKRNSSQFADIIKSHFPDPAGARLEVQGNWARLVAQVDDHESQVLFTLVDGKWLYVDSDKDAPPPDEPLWPVDDADLFLPPVTLGIRISPQQTSEGQMRFELTVRNDGDAAITGRQLWRFFSSVPYFVNREPWSSPGLGERMPESLPPGQEVVVCDWATLNSAKSGKYVIQWMRGKCASEPLEVKLP